MRKGMGNFGKGGFRVEQIMGTVLCRTCMESSCSELRNDLMRLGR